LVFFALLSAYPYYISSSQILSRSSSIESISYRDSSSTTEGEKTIIKKERTESISSNASSLLSRKKTSSAHSKSQETIDTAPFTIDLPVDTSKPEEKPQDQNKTIDKPRESLPEIKPEEKIIDHE